MAKELGGAGKGIGGIEIESITIYYESFTVCKEGEVS